MQSYQEMQATQLVAIAGAGTVVVGVGAEAVAGIAKILSLYEKGFFLAAISDVGVATAYMVKYHKHHNDPKWGGGDPKKPYQTTLSEKDHQLLHSAMNDFLRGINQKLAPARGNSGKKIRFVFGRNYILKKLAEFYRLPAIQQKFKQAADNFFKLHPTL